MSQEAAWSFPEACPHCGAGKANNGDAEVTYKCRTSLVDDREYRGYECFESEIGRLKRKVKAAYAKTEHAMKVIQILSPSGDIAVAMANLQFLREELCEYRDKEAK
jgi:uncharacterized Fe-S cluster-containing protein